MLFIHCHTVITPGGYNRSENMQLSTLQGVRKIVSNKDELDVIFIDYLNFAGPINLYRLMTKIMNFAPLST